MKTRFSTCFLAVVTVAAASPVAEAIDALYPDDEARGYQLGELRGAFTITWPAD